MPHNAFKTLKDFKMESGKTGKLYSLPALAKKFPNTKWADLAAFRMLDNKLCGDWLAQSKCPEMESALYEKYVAEHPQSPKAAEALYLAAWRQAALIERIYLRRQASTFSASGTS